MIRPPPRSTLFPYTALFRSVSKRQDQFVRGTMSGYWFPVNYLRSEEHTSELQSLTNLVCRLLLEKTVTPPTSSRNSAHRTSTQLPQPHRRPTAPPAPPPTTHPRPPPTNCPEAVTPFFFLNPPAPPKFPPPPPPTPLAS